MRILKGVKRLTQKILLTCPKNITSILPKFRSQKGIICVLQNENVK